MVNWPTQKSCKFPHELCRNDELIFDDSIYKHFLDGHLSVYFDFYLIMHKIFILNCFRQ